MDGNGNGSFRGTLTVNSHQYVLGNVGIGTTSPSSTLTVNGCFKVYKSDNYLSYNGFADICLKCTSRGNGGRALVHDTGNKLTINYNGDFTGGTRVGTNTFFSNSGDSYLNSGRIGIGTDKPSAKLDVAGNIKAEEIEVTLASMDNLNLNGTLAANQITIKANGNTADFVFNEDYNLKDLTEVENYIKIYKHLPDIPSAEEMEKKGVDLAEMNKLLLQKVEELTLYQIEKDKEVKELKESVKKEQDVKSNEREERLMLTKKLQALEEEMIQIKTLLIRENSKQ